MKWIGGSLFSVAAATAEKAAAAESKKEKAAAAAAEKAAAAEAKKKKAATADAEKKRKAEEKTALIAEREAKKKKTSADTAMQAELLQKLQAASPTKLEAMMAMF